MCLLQHKASSSTEILDLQFTDLLLIRVFHLQDYQYFDFLIQEQIWPLVSEVFEISKLCLVKMWRRCCWIQNSLHWTSRSVQRSIWRLGQEAEKLFSKAGWRRWRGAQQSFPRWPSPYRTSCKWNRFHSDNILLPFPPILRHITPTVKLYIYAFSHRGN